MLRESILARTLVELADNLVDEFDVVDMLTNLANRCVDTFDISAAGIMLVYNGSGELRVMASSSEAMRILELLELQHLEGPCPDCFHTGQPVVEAELSDVTSLWPNFTPQAVLSGFKAVYALPMKLRETTIGALNLFHTEPQALSESDTIAAQAFADIATIAIIQYKQGLKSAALSSDLQNALDSRVIIEQAKGMLAERRQIGPDDAFTKLRVYARRNNRKLTDVSRDLVTNQLPAGSLDFL